MIVSVTFSACTSQPIKDQQKPLTSAQRQQTQQVQFAQGKDLFLRKQYAAAASILLPLAREGHTGAQYTIGYMYHYGYGLPRNEKESTRWIATAAARGHPQAIEALARINAVHDEQGVVTMPADTPGVVIISPPTVVK